MWCKSLQMCRIFLGRRRTQLGSCEPKRINPKPVRTQSLSGAHANSHLLFFHDTRAVLPRERKGCFGGRELTAERVEVSGSCGPRAALRPAEGGTVPGRVGLTHACPPSPRAVPSAPNVLRCVKGSSSLFKTQGAFFKTPS